MQTDVGGLGAVQSARTLDGARRLVSVVFSGDGKERPTAAKPPMKPKLRLRPAARGAAGLPRTKAEWAAYQRKCRRAEQLRDLARADQAAMAARCADLKLKLLQGAVDAAALVAARDERFEQR